MTLKSGTSRFALRLIRLRVSQWVCLGLLLFGALGTLAVLIGGRAGTLYDQARLLHQQGHYEKAIRYYRAALRTNPYLTPAHLGLAESLAALGLYSEALMHLRIGLTHSRIPGPELQRLRALEAEWTHHSHLPEN